MREVLGIHCCPKPGCPKIGRSGDTCPVHKLRLWKFNYRRVSDGTPPAPTDMLKLAFDFLFGK